MPSFSHKTFSNMVWCTYCGQAFTRAEHLDRHVMTHTNVKPFKCTTCHFSFKRRDLLQRHQIIMHKEAEDTSSDQENGTVQRRPIACVACARAKTKCDKSIPSCTRCTSKGLVCEARSTKRSNDAAYRLARRQLSSYQRPIPIASAEKRSGTPGEILTFANERPFSTLTPDFPMSYSPLSMAYQQQPLTPPNTVKSMPMTPQDIPTSFVNGGCDFLSSFSSSTSLPNFYASSYPQCPGIQLQSSTTPSSFCDDILYQEPMDMSGVEQFPSAETQFLPLAGFGCSQTYAPTVDYSSLTVGQEFGFGSTRPSRSSSMNSSTSGSW
ncbi:hypothetical protein EJ08DRAFT_734405 [Tothia fuscella]|uniref:Uncharacterized protein n=1 Tax=Tothia fuscella TaxID=1048955 RepID=A0A9P4TY08_9PEZI|nr:hypothetical protein EJ08DRAFT_734405 [Tothia fuscella]